jgi:chromosome segregation protein
MLTRLELIGFKSFADRTRFDFAPGVTAVVGPNGSGKSNIVDAVRWILGEQSAKNLRGGEMTDVIFNGSSNRKSLGMAEVTMTFDNARRQLAADSDEVQVTRRVYRDGEGEYAINGKGCRLKDVKDLFLGSGAGHGAYSIIEQGRVDALLAASTKDRRTIFEEAAGISRFKVKKLETIRKLERVDGDLTRVRDILGELEAQLRTLRLQAAKAQRFQEYTTRLRDLRVAAGLAEFRQLSTHLEAEETALAALKHELADSTARTEAAEKQLQELNWDLSRTEDSLRHHETRLADARQQIASQESTAKAERAQTANLEAEVLRLAKQRADLGFRVKALEAEATKSAADLAATSERAAAEETRAAAAAEALAAVGAQIADLARRSQADRELQFDLVGRSAKAHSDADTNRTQAERMTRELQRKKADADHAAARFDAIEAALADLSRSDADVRNRLGDARVSLATHTAARDALRARADGLQADLDTLREQRSALRGRADVLEGLEKSLEGFGAGVRAVVERIAAGEPELSAGIAGLVADVLTVPRELAALVDIVLGETSQRFVTRDRDSLATVLRVLGEVPGRVGFVPLLSPSPLRGEGS